MPRKLRVPKYRLNKTTARAVVTLNGVDHWLGRHGTPESREKYDRLIAEWLASGRVACVPATIPDLTIVELIDRFWTHVEAFYRRPDGSPTSEVGNFRDALRPLKALYGSTPAGTFGPKGLPARAPLDKLIRPFAHAPVTCWIGLVDLSDLATVKGKWTGPVTKTVDGPDGLPGVVDVEVSGWKSLIQYPTGLELSERCGNIFAFSPCAFPIADHRRTGTCTAVNGFSFTFEGDVLIPAGYSTYWEGGSVRNDGLELKIIGRTDHTFRLNKLPPPEWVGQTVEIKPGCLKLIKNCRERGQEHQFNGIGIAVPLYDPTIDDPTGTTE